jgi:HAD superfamily phosphoserine phosphatase-like hydrolase
MKQIGRGYAVLFVDFDGTIVNTDTAQIALDRFGDPGWLRIDQEFERGQASFEESLRREFAMLKAPPEAIIEEVRRVTAIRPNFDRLMDYCRDIRLPVAIVSGGLDFCIRHFLNRDGWLRSMKIYAPISKFTGNGYTVTFPELSGDGWINFKDGLVRKEKLNGKRVFFVGNGYGDLSAAKEATYSFAIKGSRLAELLQEQRIKHEEIDDFQQLVAALQHRI